MGWAGQARHRHRFGRPPFAVETMLRVHFMRQWFTLSDPAMEEARHDVPLLVRGTAGSVNNVVEANTLLHGEEAEAWGDADYQSADKRPDAKQGMRWNIAMRQGKLLCPTC